MDSDDEQVFVPIVVVVTDSHPHAVSLPLQAGFFSYIGKGSVMVVAVETVPVIGTRFEERWKRRAIGAEQIGPAVAVEVEHAEPAGERFHLVFTAGCAVAKKKIQFSGAGSVPHLDRS